MTKEVTLGEAKITSHIHHGHQELWIKLKDCSLEICPHWKDRHGNENTSLSITINDHGHTVVKRCSRNKKLKYLWLNIYKEKL